MFLFRNKRYQMMVIAVLLVFLASFTLLLWIILERLYLSFLLSAAILAINLALIRIFLQKTLPFNNDTKARILFWLTLEYILYFGLAGLVFSLMLIFLPLKPYRPGILLLYLFISALIYLLQISPLFSFLIRRAGGREVFLGRDYLNPVKGQAMSICVDGDLKSALPIKEKLKFTDIKRGSKNRPSSLEFFIYLSRYSLNKKLDIYVNNRLVREVSLSVFPFDTYQFHKAYSESWIKLSVNIHDLEFSYIDIALAGKKFFMERVFSGYGALVSVPRKIETKLKKDTTKDERNIILISLDSANKNSLEEIFRDNPELAKMGFGFYGGWSTSNWTLPAHVSMLSGLMPSAHKSYNASRINKKVPWIPQLLSGHGYLSCGIVSHNRVSSYYNFHRGFDYFWEKEYEKGRFDSYFYFNKGLDFIRKVCGDKFLFLHLFDAHQPYLPCWNFVDYSIEKETIKRFYQEEVSQLLDNLIRFFSCLREEEWFRDSLIIITSDHGELFGENGQWGHSGKLHPNLMDVPFLVKAHKEIKAKDNFISLTDIFPTICEYAGIQDIRQSGVSLFSEEEREFIMCEGFDILKDNFYSAAVKMKEGRFFIQNFDYSLEELIKRIKTDTLCEEAGPISPYIKEEILNNHRFLENLNADYSRRIDLTSNGVIKKRLQELGYM